MSCYDEGPISLPSRPRSRSSTSSERSDARIQKLSGRTDPVQRRSGGIPHWTTLNTFFFKPMTSSRRSSTARKRASFSRQDPFHQRQCQLFCKLYVHPNQIRYELCFFLCRFFFFCYGSVVLCRHWLRARNRREIAVLQKVRCMMQQYNANRQPSAMCCELASTSLELPIISVASDYSSPTRWRADE